MNRVIVSFLVISFSLLIKSCDTTDPPDNKSLTLRLEDVSCTEAWIKLTTTNLPTGGGPPTAIILKQNDNVRYTINLRSADTLLYVDSLLPNTSYRYQVSSIQNPVSSNELSVTTMDTTSHNFIFETFTFGGNAGSCILYDVAIINENDIWTVGEINIADTSINGYTTYNAVHWDGSQWELKRIKTNACGGVDYPPIKAIFAFAADDILFAHIDGSISHFNGIEFTNDCSLITQLNGSANRIWGISKSDYYVVSGNGFIAHYQNWQWRRITSGTDVDLKDIYGTKDGENIWISGYEDFKPTVLVKISNSIIEIVFNTRYYLSGFNPDHISGEITSVWTNSNNFVYVTTPFSLYRKSIYIDPSREEALRFGDPLSWLGRRSRGTEINNIFIAGNRGNVHHYNGVTFKSYQELANNGVTYYSLDVKGNLSVLCGQKFENGINDKAIITFIK